MGQRQVVSCIAHKIGKRLLIIGMVHMTGSLASSRNYRMIHQESKARKRNERWNSNSVLSSMSSTVTILIPPLRSFSTFLGQREYFILLSDRPSGVHKKCCSRSRSVASRPSRKACAVLPEDPPAPACPRAAKCWAWSMTSSRRSRNAYVELNKM